MQHIPKLNTSKVKITNAKRDRANKIDENETDEMIISIKRSNSATEFLKDESEKD